MVVMNIGAALFGGVRKVFMTPVLLLLVVASGGVAVYSYSLYQKAQNEVQRLQNPQEAAKQEVAKLVEAVGKLVAIPEGEQPTIATVVDSEKLKDQPFFTRAENGDKLLVYVQTRRAILYRPSINKVIDVAPVNIGPGQGGQSAKVRVALYNGTEKTGVTNPVEDKLKKQITNIDVVKKENAAKQDYEGLLVVDVNGNQQNAAAQMAKVLGAKVEALPDGEAKPDADLLIIVGK